MRRIPFERQILTLAKDSNSPVKQLGISRGAEAAVEALGRVWLGGGGAESLGFRLHLYKR